MIMTMTEPFRDAYGELLVNQAVEYFIYVHGNLKTAHCKYCHKKAMYLKVMMEQQHRDVFVNSRTDLVTI